MKVFKRDYYTLINKLNNTIVVRLPKNNLYKLINKNH